MKRIRFTILALVMLLLGGMMTVHAEIILPYGEGQIGLQAVVLCEELTVRETPSVSSGVVQILPHGSRINLPYGWEVNPDGWAYCVLGDSEDAEAGWVKADYILIDPAWYRTGRNTPVYAWNETSAPKVALLDRGVTLPIVKEEGNWLIVSLRGAVGWIYNGSAR